MVNRVVVAAIALLACLPGCAGKRPQKTPAELLAMREQADRRFEESQTSYAQRTLRHVRAEYAEFKAGRTPTPPTFDILIISGGGDWGAFGAGVLKGWGRVPPGEMARPQFDAVTGVSTGALIAPFAFVGTDQSIERVVRLYRNPRKDWVKQRWPLYFLPSNISFAEVPGLERELKENVDMELVRAIAGGSEQGRALVMNTTNVDDGSMQVWDVGAEAERAVRENSLERVHTIMLASSGIPAAFPFRIIDGEMYVDGGITGNIVYGGRVRQDQSLAAQWKELAADLPMPRVRYWIIFNNQLRPLPQVTAPTWTAVISRSLEMGTRAATLTAMRHLFTMVEVSRLKYGIESEIRIVAVPNDWVPPKPGVFVKETMNSLADLGEKMGADPSCWRAEPPPP